MKALCCLPSLRAKNKGADYEMETLPSPETGPPRPQLPGPLNSNPALYTLAPEKPTSAPKKEAKPAKAPASAKFRKATPILNENLMKNSRPISDSHPPINDDEYDSDDDEADREAPKNGAGALQNVKTRILRYVSHTSVDTRRSKSSSVGNSDEGFPRRAELRRKRNSRIIEDVQDGDTKESQGSSSSPLPRRMTSPIGSILSVGPRDQVEPYVPDGTDSVESTISGQQRAFLAPVVYVAQDRSQTNADVLPGRTGLTGKKGKGKATTPETRPYSLASMHHNAGQVDDHDVAARGSEDNEGMSTSLTVPRSQLPKYRVTQGTPSNKAGSSADEDSTDYRTGIISEDTSISASSPTKPPPSPYLESERDVPLDAILCRGVLAQDSRRHDQKPIRYRYSRDVTDEGYTEPKVSPRHRDIDTQVQLQSESREEEEEEDDNHVMDANRTEPEGEGRSGTDQKDRDHTDKDAVPEAIGGVVTESSSRYGSTSNSRTASLQHSVPNLPAQAGILELQISSSRGIGDPYASTVHGGSGGNPHQVAQDDNNDSSSVRSVTSSYARREVEQLSVEERFANSHLRNRPVVPKSSSFREEFNIVSREAQEAGEEKKSSLFCGLLKLKKGKWFHKSLDGTVANEETVDSDGKAVNNGTVINDGRMTNDGRMINHEQPEPSSLSSTSRALYTLANDRRLGPSPLSTTPLCTADDLDTSDLGRFEGHETVEEYHNFLKVQASMSNLHAQLNLGPSVECTPATGHSSTANGRFKGHHAVKKYHKYLKEEASMSNLRAASTENYATATSGRSATNDTESYHSYPAYSTNGETLSYYSYPAYSTNEETTMGHGQAVMASDYEAALPGQAITTPEDTAMAVTEQRDTTLPASATGLHQPDGRSQTTQASLAIGHDDTLLAEDMSFVHLDQGLEEYYNDPDIF